MKNLLLVLLAGLLLLSCGSTGAKTGREDKTTVSSKIMDVPALKEPWEPYFMVGNVMSFRDIDEPEFKMLVRHFNIATAENDMKPQYLQSRKGSFSFGSADAVVDAVLAAGLKMHGHTLAWHQQSPAWMNSEGIARNEAVENLVTHAKTVVEHFKGRVISWDVLNEAVSDNPSNPGNWRGALRATPWLKAIGPDYIEMVFLAAREADPDAILYYNDYNMDNQNKAAAVFNMVKEINEKHSNAHGRPLIDGIGMQGHYRTSTNIENVEKSLKLFISLGVEVSVTELDVQAGANYMLPRSLATEQGVVYARLFALLRENAAHIGRVTIWGLSDGASWRKAASPTLFDPQFMAKPAFFAALDPDAFLAEYKPPVQTAKAAQQSEARYGSPSWDAADRLWQNAPAIPVNLQVMAWQGAQGSARVLWDEQHLYVLITVNNAELNKANSAPHEQDSIEIFVDEGNHKSNSYMNDDGQYRVNFANEQSFNPSSIAAGFESRTTVANKTYTVIAKIPFRTIKPGENTLIGFDLQINGASAQGMRQSIAVWNDTSGNAYQNPSGFGELRLVK